MQPCLCSLKGEHVSAIKEILKVFIPLSDNIPSQCQQLLPSAVNSVNTNITVTYTNINLGHHYLKC